MFKAKSDTLPSNLDPHQKLKRRVWTISMAFFTLSLLLIDIGNVSRPDQQYWLVLVIKNIPLFAVWGLAFLIAPKHRVNLKIFTPLYFSLILLVLSSTMIFNNYYQSQKINEKVIKEVANIFNMASDNGYTSLNKISQYSVQEYGTVYAPFLNKFKEMVLLVAQQGEDLAQSFIKTDMNSIFIGDIIYSHSSILSKKKQLESLILDINNYQTMVKETQENFKNWVLTSSKTDKRNRGYFVTSDERKASFQNPLDDEFWRIQKEITSTHIELLSFLSEIYGTYEKGENQKILCHNADDIPILQSYSENISNLYKQLEHVNQAYEETLKKMGIFPSP